MDVELAKDFKEFLKSLQSNNVRYLLIGGYAVGYHGYPRATNDLDVFVGNDAANIESLRNALTEFGFAQIDLSAETFGKDKKLIEIGTEPIKIELLNFASGLEFEKAFENRTYGVIDGIEVSLVSLEDLKTNKKASGRHKDLDDWEHLEALS